MLNWTLAEALTERLRSEPDKSGEIIADVCKLLVDPRIPSGRMLGIRADGLSMAAARRISPGGPSGAIGTAVDAMESALGPGRSDMLFEELLPTLGSRILPELVKRLEDKAVGGPLPAVRTLASAVAAIGGDAARSAARELLDDSRPMVQRAGMQVSADARTRPSSTAHGRSTHAPALIKHTISSRENSGGRSTRTPSAP